MLSTCLREHLHKLKQTQTDCFSTSSTSYSSAGRSPGRKPPGLCFAHLLHAVPQIFYRSITMASMVLQDICIAYYEKTLSSRRICASSLMSMVREPCTGVALGVWSFKWTGLLSVLIDLQTVS